MFKGVVHRGAEGRLVRPLVKFGSQSGKSVVTAGAQLALLLLYGPGHGMVLYTCRVSLLTPMNVL